MICYFMASTHGIPIDSTMKLRNGTRPMIVAVEMGYGHLRAAHTLAEAFDTEIIRMDLPPVAGPAEAAVWRGIVRFYSGLSQACDWPVAGAAAQTILGKITEIAPPRAQVNGTTWLTEIADSLTANFMGRRLRSLAAKAEGPVLTTYPAAAMAARHASGTRIFCLVTDTDANRAWAPANASNPAIDYFAPVPRVVDRLRSFGVPEKRIHLTGFPLSPKLVAEAQTALAGRLRRLDPRWTFRSQAGNELRALAEDSPPDAASEPITMTVAIGGAGGQTGYVGKLLRSLRKQVLAGKLRLNLVAGTRADVAEILRKLVDAVGLTARVKCGIEIVLDTELRGYFRKFEDCLAKTDVLWTKPSELTFYAALGIPMLLAPPIGGQEHANRDWLLSNNAALDAGDPTTLDDRIEHLLEAGELCRVAWNAYSRFDRNGLDRIQKVINSI